MTTGKTVLQRKLLPALDFLLHDWLKVDELTSRPRFEEHGRETFDELLQAASEVAANRFEPAYRISDEQEPYMADGGVVTPKETHLAFEAYRDLGILAASHDVEFGGMQLPRTLDLASRVIFGASGHNLAPAMLTDANASLLIEHGTETQKRVFAVPELAFRWTGTMCLSESQAGSSLADITTSAVPDGQDHESEPLGPRYRITGNKMWISAAEHDLTENIIHLVLAKIPVKTDRSIPAPRASRSSSFPRYWWTRTLDCSNATTSRWSASTTRSAIEVLPTPHSPSGTAHTHLAGARAPLATSWADPAMVCARCST